MNEKLKILRVGSLPTGNRPGSGLAMSKLHSDDRLQSQVFSYSAKENDENLFSAPNISYLNFIQVEMPKKRIGLKFFWLQIIRGFGLIKFFFEFIFKKKDKPNILHLHTPMHFLLLWWAHLSKIKTCLTFHGTDFQRVINSRIYQYFIKNVDTINCVCLEHKIILENKFPKASVNYVANGVDESFFNKNSIEQRKNQIIAIGTLRWHKGFSNLINAFNMLGDANNDWVLKIVGEGPDKEKLQNQISKLNLENKVFLTGIKSKELVEKELSNSKIFVLSSVTEGLPKVLLEGMASGCACITTDVGDCKEVLISHGQIVPINNNNELSKALKKYINNKEALIQSSKRCIQRAKEYSWKSYLDKHYKIYKEMILN